MSRADNLTREGVVPPGIQLKSFTLQLPATCQGCEDTPPSNFNKIIYVTRIDKKCHLLPGLPESPQQVQRISEWP